MAHKMIGSGKQAASLNNSMRQRPVGAYVGGVTIRDEFDALFWQLVTSIDGQLTILGGGNVVLPNLISASTIIVQPSAYTLTSLSLPTLQTCSEYLYVGGLSLTALNLPALATASDIVIEHITALTSIGLPELTSANSVLIEDNNDCTSVALTKLQTATQIRVRSNADLASLNLTALAQVTPGGLDIRYGKLTSLSCPALLSVDGLVVAYLYLLTTMSFPLLTTTGTSGLVLTDCISATPVTFSLPSLVNVGSANGGYIEIMRNRTVGVNGFTDAAAHALVAQLVGPPAHDPVTNVSIGNNDQ